jgi:hypothetical protein
VARRYREGGWPAEVEGDGFTAPFSARAGGRRRGTCTASGSTPWSVATAEPYGTTRWRFER